MLPPFIFDADPDPAFHFEEDPDPMRFGSATLGSNVQYNCVQDPNALGISN